LIEEYPNLVLYLTVEVLKEPTAYFWNLYVSPTGEEPPRDPMKRLFRIEATVSDLERVLGEFPCDNVNIFTPTGFPDTIVHRLKAIFEKKALENQTGSP
jgi:hypothetical protein